MLRTRVPGIALLLAVACAPTTADATFPGRNGLIAYSARPAACPNAPAADILTMRRDGRRRSNLTRYSCGSGYMAFDPRWAVDGRRILFRRAYTTGWDLSGPPAALVVMGARGRHKRDVASAEEVGWFDWASGRNLVASGGVYVGPFSNLKQRRVADGDRPSWSPDQHSLAFVEATGCGGRLATVDLRTATQRILVESRHSRSRCSNTVWTPDWSPDGRRIVYVGVGPNGADTGSNRKVHVVNVRSRRQVQLTRWRGDDFGPVWSPDGQWIAFLHKPKCCDVSDLYVMRQDGSERRRIARRALAVSWQPKID